MNTNIEKALYLGVGVLLLALAFTFFFSSYRQHRAYIGESLRIINEDRIVTISEENVDSYISGYELIHLILEEKKRTEEGMLSHFYSDDSVNPYKNNSYLWVSGKMAFDMDLSQIDPAMFYVASYEKDSWGKVNKVHYTVR